MTPRNAYLVGFFANLRLVRVGIYSEPHPTTLDLASHTCVLATAVQGDYANAERRLRKYEKQLNKMIEQTKPQ